MKEKTLYDFYPLNLLRDILNESDLSRAYIPGIEIALSEFKDMDRDMLKSRYELHMTFKEIGNKLGVTHERARQIIQKILFKLNQPKYVCKFIGISMEEHNSIMMEKLAEKDAAAAEQERDIIKFYTNNAYQQGAKLPPDFSLMQEPIKRLGLSVRVHNTLMRAGKRTVGDIAKMTQCDLLEIPYLWHKSLEEIMGKMRELGIEIRFFNRGGSYEC